MSKPREGTPGAAHLPYATDEKNAWTWTEKAYDFLEQGELEVHISSARGIDTVQVSGTCPRCNHVFVFSLPLEVVAGESMSSLGVEPFEEAGDTLSLTVTCRCGEPHDGREKGDRGCGINFKVIGVKEQ